MPSISNVIGEGTYGCAIKPSLVCRNKSLTYDNKISKVLLDKHANTELNEYGMIDKVDKNKEFYMGKPELCKPIFNDENVKSIQKCDSIGRTLKTNVEDNFNKLSLLVMDDGGVNLSTYSQNLNSKSETQIMNFFVEAHRILLGLKVFIDNGIVHHDLKPQNIVYNEELNRLNFIDFGLTVTTNKILEDSQNSKNRMATYHWSFPFEMNFYNVKSYNQIANYSPSEKIRYINNTNKTSLFMGSFKTFLSYVNSREQNINNYIKDFYQTILTDIVPGNYNNFIKKSISTIDIYGTGIAFNLVLNKCAGVLQKNAYEDLHTLFLNMVSADLSKRYGINEVITIYENILQTHLLPPNMSFENHKLINTELEEAIDTQLLPIHNADVKLSKQLIQKYSNQYPNKCGEHKEFNPNTKRCVKHCKPDFLRNEHFKCVKIPKTKKVRSKKCKNGKKVNSITNACVRIPKTKKARSKHCDNNTELNPNTNRCVKNCKPNYVRNTQFKCVRMTKMKKANITPLKQ